MTDAQYGNWQKYQSKNPVQQALINRFLGVLTALVDPLEVRSVLDAGCGEGFVLNMLLQHRPTMNVIGIDIDREAIQRGRKLFPDMPFQVADVLELPHPDDSFDLVVCTEVLEHLADPQTALHEICRVSRRYCLLSVPHEPLFRLSNLLRGKSILRLGNDIDHLHNWTQIAFVRLLQPHLQLVAIRRSFPWQIVLGEVK